MSVLLMARVSTGAYPYHGTGGGDVGVTGVTGI